jgi:hypothetical protein
VASQDLPGWRIFRMLNRYRHFGRKFSMARRRRRNFSKPRGQTAKRAPGRQKATSVTGQTVPRADRTGQILPGDRRRRQKTTAQRLCCQRKHATTEVSRLWPHTCKLKRTKLFLRTNSMHLALPSTGSLSSIASQAMSSFASRAATATKVFGSDLESGNVAGARSFLATLEQEFSTGNSGTKSNPLSSQFAQVSNDLSTGDLSRAQSDFSQLEMAISNFKHDSGGLTSSFGPQTKYNASAAPSAPGNSSLSALNPSYLMQQSAYNSALNLSVPATVPSFTANW